jgi:hypothetical protein
MEPEQTEIHHHLKAFAEAPYVIRMKVTTLYWLQVALLPVMFTFLMLNLLRAKPSQLWGMLVVDISFILCLGIGLVLLRKGCFAATVKLHIVSQCCLILFGSLIKLPIMEITGYNHFNAEMFCVIIFASIFGTRSQLLCVAAFLLTLTAATYLYGRTIVAEDLKLHLQSGSLNAAVCMLATIFLAYINEGITRTGLRISQQELVRNQELNRTLEQRVAERTRALSDKYKERKELTARLEKSLAEVKILSGFLPICSACKKIRDDSGYWNQIETYISTHSQAQFSHSLCPECLHRLYPGLKKGADNSDG